MAAIKGFIVVGFSLLLLGAVDAFQWIGMTPEPLHPQQINLFNLNINGSRADDIASLTLTHPNEQVSVDSFRCKPYGTFCVVSTSNGTASWLYNISLADPTNPEETFLPGVTIHNLHVDHTSGAVYTILLSPGRAVVSQLLLGEVTSLIDISSYLGTDGEIFPGSSAQCSDTNSMWIQIVHQSTASTLMEVSLPQRVVQNVVKLASTLFASLWAYCDNDTNENVLGGSAVLGHDGTMEAVYAHLNNNTGQLSVVASATIPSSNPPLGITHLLSEPVFYDYFFTLYPDSASPGGPQASGYIAFGSFSATLSQLKLVPIDYYLTGAARLT